MIGDATNNLTLKQRFAISAGYFAAIVSCLVGNILASVWARASENPGLFREFSLFDSVGQLPVELVLVFLIVSLIIVWITSFLIARMAANLPLYPGSDLKIPQWLFLLFLLVLTVPLAFITLDNIQSLF